MSEAAKLTPELFRRVCGQFATGVTIITACDATGEPHGMTVNSFTSLSLDPPLVMAAISRNSQHLAIFERAGHFAVNILAASQRDLSDRFARRHEQRFAGIDWHAGSSGAPLFAGVLATLECRQAGMVDTGDHRVVIGEVELAQLHHPEAEPLLFFRGRYAGIS